jgi:hypothetical protein
MVTRMDKIDTFRALPGEEYEIATMLYETGKSLNCKILYNTRALKNQPKGYRIIFNKRETNSVLFWMQISDNALYVKANLFHIYNYAETMSACSEKIKKAITATKECIYCGLCPPRLPYHIDNAEYNPCVFHGHYFTQMDHEDWYMLKELLILEHDNQYEPDGMLPIVPSERQEQDRPYHGFHRK